MQRVDSDKKKMSEAFGELFTKSSQNIMSVKGLLSNVHVFYKHM